MDSPGGASPAPSGTGCRRGNKRTNGKNPAGISHPAEALSPSNAGSCLHRPAMPAATERLRRPSQRPWVKLCHLVPLLPKCCFWDGRRRWWSVPPAFTQPSSLPGSLLQQTPASPCSHGAGLDAHQHQLPPKLLLALRQLSPGRCLCRCPNPMVAQLRSEPRAAKLPNVLIYFFFNVASSPWLEEARAGWPGAVPKLVPCQQHPPRTLVPLGDVGCVCPEPPGPGWMPWRCSPALIQADGPGVSGDKPVSASSGVAGASQGSAAPATGCSEHFWGRKVGKMVP